MSLFNLGAPEEKIFVSYRRQDRPGFAGRLADSLDAHFGADRVFRDVTGIEVGSDFEQAIEQQLSESGAFLVVIGPDWLDAKGENGGRRLDDPEDYVAYEIATALASDLTVIPILVDDAEMPSAKDLPDRLGALSKRNAMSVRDTRWAGDIDRLARVLAIDLAGSLNENRLGRLRAATMMLLIAGGAFTTLSFARATMCATDASKTWCPEPDPMMKGVIGQLGFPPLVCGVAFFTIVFAAAAIVAAAPRMEAASRRYAWGAFLIAALGTTAAFLYYTLVNNTDATGALAVAYAISSVVIQGMLAMLVMSGYRAE